MSTARQQVIQEIKDTEQRYLNGLDIFSKEFVAKVVERKFKDTTFSEIFTILETIINFSRELLKQLKRSDDVGKVFLRVIPVLTSYSQYFNCHNKIQKLLQTDTQLSQCVNELETKCILKGYQTFGSYAITPVQRIPRYNLLLRELLKNTNPQHHDYTNIKNAMDGIQSVATVLNTGLREHHKQTMHEQLMKRLHGNEEYKSATWVAETWATVSETSMTIIERRLYCVLVSDTILICETDNDTAPLRIIHKVHLNNAYQLTKGLSTSISIIMNDTERSCYIFNFSTDKERDDWAELLDSKIKQRYNTNHAIELKALTTTTRAGKWGRRQLSGDVTSPTSGPVTTSPVEPTLLSAQDAKKERQSRRESVRINFLVTKRK